MDLNEVELLSTGRNEPRLANPSVDEIIEIAGIDAVARSERTGVGDTVLIVDPNLGTPASGAKALGFFLG
jgi:hypothetical protein